jgi:hypothetical protein
VGRFELNSFRRPCGRENLCRLALKKSAEPGGHPLMATERDLRSVVEEVEDWIEAWNCKDLDRIMLLHFELEEVFTAPSGYAALYRRDNGNRVLDVVELDDSCKAVSVKAFYLGPQNRRSAPDTRSFAGPGRQAEDAN